MFTTVRSPICIYNTDMSPCKPSLPFLHFSLHTSLLCSRRDPLTHPPHVSRTDDSEIGEVRKETFEDGPEVSFGSGNRQRFEMMVLGQGQVGQGIFE